MGSAEKWWDKQAARFDARSEKRGPTYRATVGHAKKHLRRSDEVLEIGCGGGSYTCDLAGSVSHIHATDLSATMIDVATRKARERGIANVDFARATASELEHAPGSFDAVAAFNVLHLVEDVDRDLRRIREVLKPGGLLISTTACLGKAKSLIGLLIRFAAKLGLVPKVRLYTTGELEAVIARAGFEIVEAETLNRSSRNHLVVARRA